MISIANLYIQETCRVFEANRKQLLGQSRERYIVKARQCCAVAMYENTRLSTTQVAGVLNRDHTTILHARRAINAERQKWQDSLDAIVAGVTREKPVYIRPPRMFPPVEFISPYIVQTRVRMQCAPPGARGPYHRHGDEQQPSSITPPSREQLMGRR